MDLRFVAQPYEDGTDLRDFLHAVASAPDLLTLRIIVAWAKRSGLRRADQDLKAVRDRGGKVLAIAGVSEGGATEQGLTALIEMSDQAYVFHDAGRTFHPKIYLAESDKRALLLVGSNNFTAGGLAWNYEAGLWAELDLDEMPDLAVRNDVVAYFDRLRNDTDVCRPLDDSVVQAMLTDSALIIQNEDSTKRPKANRSIAESPEDTDSTEAWDDEDEEPLWHVFGKSALKKRNPPQLATGAPQKAPKASPAPVAGSVEGEPSDLTIVRRWFKRMDGTAAQWPPGATTKRTGNLRLSQEDFAIDHTKYFHEIFFGGLSWAPSARYKGIDEVWVQMQTIIGGDFLGNVNIRISYAAKRIANQGNVSTVLHWGDLGQRMRQNNYQGMYVTLERAVGNQFALTIADAPTGDFQY